MEENPLQPNSIYEPAASSVKKLIPIPVIIGFLLFATATGAFYFGRRTAAPPTPTPDPIPISTIAPTQPVIGGPTDVQPSPKKKPIFGTSIKKCSVDEDCFLNEVARCSMLCDPCDSLDVSGPRAESISRSWCDGEKQKALDEIGEEYATCPACIGSIGNPLNAVAQCQNNRCVRCIGNKCE